VSTLFRWIDSYARVSDRLLADETIDWPRVLPFIGLHLACFGALWTGVSATALAVASALYAARMLAITGFYHRYFSHRAFRTSRAMQLVFAIIGASAVQRGPLWWASHHRHHHAHADRAADAHSPRHRGFLWSHTGWFLSRGNFPTRFERVRDFERYPELRFLDRFDVLVPALLAAALYGLGEMLASRVPELGTSGWQLVVWGFAISTVVLYHATFTVNSLAHSFGQRRYATPDDSRNNPWLALLTFGEGWHNNHHHYPGSARQGFYWWEIDLTYYFLKGLAAFGLIWDLRPVPVASLEARRLDREQPG
jgi:stearoyl-CoA desaturase (delta-9 desaturase)